MKNVKNRAQLVAYLKAECAYNGDGSDANIKAFVSDPLNSIELKGASLDELLGKKVTIEYAADAGEEVEAKAKTAQDDEFDGDSGNADAPVGHESAQRVPTRKKTAEKFIKAQSELFAPRVLSTCNKAAFERVKMEGKVYLPDQEHAEQLGASFRLALVNMLPAEFRNYSQKRADLEIVGKTMVTNINEQGGAWVNPEFQATLIVNKSRYGALRKATAVLPMSRDTLTIPENLSDVVMTWDTEGTAATAQNKPSTGTVLLVARKLQGLVKVSNELLNDSAVDFAAALLESFGRGMAKAEDDAFINGDGTSTYGGNVGCFSAVGSAGVHTSAGTTLATITAADIDTLMGKVQDWVDDDNCVFVCSRQVYFQVLHRLAAAAGGKTFGEAQNGRPAYVYHGTPVIITASMPATIPTGKQVLLYGDFKRSLKFGEVRGSNAIANSDQRYFDEDNFAFRGRERVALSVHGGGDPSNAGGISLLKTT
jgi:HK97 family phage major capsid protein